MTEFKPRLWTLDIPPPDQFISANGREDRRRRGAEMVKTWRTAGWAAARQAKLPTGLARVRIDITINPPNRDLDEHNLGPTCKALVDGFGPPTVRLPSARSKGASSPGYGLIPNDNRKHVDGYYLETLEPFPPRGRVVVVITDLTEVAAGRTWTPERRTATGKRMTVKRACNGCSRLIGDVTDEEIYAAMAGAPLSDVTGECPACLGKVSRA